MSDKEAKKNREDTQAEEQTEKYVSNYDKKMERREKEKAKAAREKKRARIVGIVLAVAVVAFILSFPIRTAMTLYGTYIKINGEKVTRVEYDYNYNILYNNYVSTYGTYLTYFGLDTSSDLSTQAYSDTLTWKDYFDEQTVESMITNAALKAEAEAASFEYDTDEEYDEFVTSLKEAASEAGVTTTEYLKATYGDYATLGRIEQYVRNSIYLDAYYTEVEESKAPTDDEIVAYYEENTDSYDSIDYYVQTIEAELPTEPTELADTTEDETTTDTDTTTDDTTTTDEEEEYEPSEAEIEKAMSDAEVLANEALETITETGTLTEGGSYTATTSTIREWLFDAERAEGDSTIIEDETNYQYYVVSFVQRYRDDTPTANVRLIVQEEGSDGQAILDEWAAGEATEDSFAALADQYNSEDLSVPDGGLMDDLEESDLSDEIAEWIFADERAYGDTTVITTESGYVYIIYYVGTGDPAWKTSISSTLTNTAMTEYIEEISADGTVDDPNGNLDYIEIEASVEASESAAAESEAAESAAAEETTEETTEPTDSTEETTDDTTESADSTESSETTDSSTN